MRVDGRVRFDASQAQAENCEQVDFQFFVDAELSEGPPSEKGDLGGFAVCLQAGVPTPFVWGEGQWQAYPIDGCSFAAGDEVHARMEVREIAGFKFVSYLVRSPSGTWLRGATAEGRSWFKGKPTATRRGVSFFGQGDIGSLSGTAENQAQGPVRVWTGGAAGEWEDPANWREILSGDAALGTFNLITNRVALTWGGETADVSFWAQFDGTNVWGADFATTVSLKTTRPRVGKTLEPTFSNFRGLRPHFDFSWSLDPGEAFQTPEAYLCYSPEGLNGMSRSFHRLVHRHITRGPFRNAARPILVNNWEATYFSFNEEKLLSLARAAKKADIDMLVLDDGWFGHRDSDNCSLGDWTDDLKKLPEGIKGLGEKLHALGMKFGLWFEPEMVSPDSELYRAHPDWCLHINGRPRTESRNQLTLDLSRQDVQDYIVSSVCAALKRGCVDYVKWDMNRNFTCVGSDLLPAGRMKELGHRYMLGLYSVLERIVSANPEVLFESCSSGGGRFDLGMLCFMPQTWTSDDTDAWERCRIQYATSYVMPPSAMGAHVSAVPNHQVGRVTPLFTRAAVAMGGTFGYELDLTKLPEEEMEEIRQINRNAHAWQSLLYYGTFIRLRSPYEGQETAWMSVSEDKKEALVTFVTGQTRANEKPGCLPLRGLDPDRDYRSEDDGRVFGGDELMYRGLPTDHRGGDYQARMVHLKAL